MLERKTKQWDFFIHFFLFKSIHVSILFLCFDLGINIIQMVILLFFSACHFFPQSWDTNLFFLNLSLLFFPVNFIQTFLNRDNIFSYLILFQNFFDIVYYFSILNNDFENIDPIHLFLENLTTDLSKSSQCYICLSDNFELQAPLKCLPCKHSYHTKCIHRWISTRKDCRCPVCKKPFYKSTRT